MKKIIYIATTIILIVMLVFVVYSVKKKGDAQKAQSSLDTKNGTENIDKTGVDDAYIDDEMVTTYAYLNNESADVESLKKIEIDLLEQIDSIINTEYKQYTEEMVWKIAFFGTVNNVEIYQSPHYSAPSTRLYQYDTLTDTELSIKARDMKNEDAVFYVTFEDERGAPKEFTSWFAGSENNKIQLNSGFTKEEKTPTKYKNFDIKPYLACIGMSEKEFLKSEIGKKSEKVSVISEDDYDYVVEIAKGILVTYRPDKEDIGEYDYRVKENAEVMSVMISRQVNDEGEFIDYKTVPESEGISIFGVDFSMTGVRAKKHFKDNLDAYDVFLTAHISPENDELSHIEIKPKSAKIKDGDFESVKDIEKVYKFIKNNVKNITMEEFQNNFVPYYFDINQDSNLDVCYSTQEWYGELIFILSDKGGYKIIESDTSSMHKIFAIDLVDNFVVVSGENIDNGYGDERIDLYYVTEGRIKYLEHFITYMFSGAETYFEGEGKVELVDGYNNFKYTYDELYYDKHRNKKQLIRIDLSYLFDQDSLSYTISEASENFNDSKNYFENKSETSNHSYYKFDANTEILFDLDQDGRDEVIKYDVDNSRLIVDGYDPITLHLSQENMEDSFIVINFSDPDISSMYMIGIYDPGPSRDPLTTFYSIIETQGVKRLKEVGEVTAQLIQASDYKNPYDFYDFANKPNTDYLEQTGDFMEKAFLIENAGIEAPSMMTTQIPQTWFGRSIYTYDSKKNILVDSYKKYEKDYETYAVLTVKKDIKVYNEKDSNGDFMFLKAGQNVLMQATDNKVWIFMRSEDGINGWIKIENVTREHFDGFAVFG